VEDTVADIHAAAVDPLRDDREVTDRLVGRSGEGVGRASPRQSDEALRGGGERGAVGTPRVVETPERGVAVGRGLHGQAVGERELPPEHGVPHGRRRGRAQYRERLGRGSARGDARPADEHAGAVGVHRVERRGVHGVEHARGLHPALLRREPHRVHEPPVRARVLVDLRGGHVVEVVGEDRLDVGVERAPLAGARRGRHARGEAPEAGRLAEQGAVVEVVGVPVDVGGQPLVRACRRGDAVAQPVARAGQSGGRRPVQPAPRRDGHRVVHDGPDHRVEDADPGHRGRPVEPDEVGEHGDGVIGLAHPADRGDGREIGPGVAEHGERVQHPGRRAQGRRGARRSPR
jgi:hypothetical protein